MDQNMQIGLMPEQGMRVSPTLIMVNQLLALSSLELQHMVRAELDENPALESLEKTTCTSCGAGTTSLYCPVCMQTTVPSPLQDGSRSRGADDGSGRTGFDDDFDPDEYRHSSPASVDDEDFDPLTLVATESSMTEQLLSDLAVSLPESEYHVAEYLVGNLDEQGFLSCTCGSAARSLGVSEAAVEGVLRVLQRMAPVGVGARDLRECLLIQLDEIKERGYPELAPHVEEILSHHLTELGEHKYTIIAQHLGISYESVVHVRDFIKTNMQPRPLQEVPRGRSWRSPSPTRFVMPDVIIQMRDGNLEAEVVEGYRFSLRINPLYQKLATESTHTGEGLTDHDRDHVRRYVNRSKLFISNINQRRETMRRITSCLISLQEEYIKFGVRYLRPLTRAQVAQYLGIHESTVSRATAAKYVMLPNKQVIPFSDFFSASLSAKDVIKEIITGEARPITDKEIVNRLREQGIRVARRTVTKYRNQLGIMPSTFR
ncbi:MAG: RNA polymerase factor sigma-54 [Chloroflexota bacterium]|nr:RNA polymerase factor sigma-54 [Chloroflexota bacterium]